MGEREDNGACTSEIHSARVDVVKDADEGDGGFEGAGDAGGASEIGIGSKVEDPGEVEVERASAGRVRVLAEAEETTAEIGVEGAAEGAGEVAGEDTGTSGVAGRVQGADERTDTIEVEDKSAEEVGAEGADEGTGTSNVEEKSVGTGSGIS